MEEVQRERDAESHLAVTLKQTLADKSRSFGVLTPTLTLALDPS